MDREDVIFFFTIAWSRSRSRVDVECWYVSTSVEGVPAKEFLMFKLVFWKSEVINIVVVINLFIDLY